MFTNIKTDKELYKSVDFASKWSFCFSAPSICLSTPDLFFKGMTDVSCAKECHLNKSAHKSVFPVILVILKKMFFRTKLQLFQLSWNVKKMELLFLIMSSIIIVNIQHMVFVKIFDKNACQFCYYCCLSPVFCVHVHNCVCVCVFVKQATNVYIYWSLCGKTALSSSSFCCWFCLRVRKFSTVLDVLHLHSALYFIHNLYMIFSEVQTTF